MWMVEALGWIGSRARWLLAVGVLAAFFMPGASAALRPALAPIVALVFCIAMARIDLGGMLRRLGNARHLLRLSLWSLALMGLTPVVLWLLGHAVGLPDSHIAAMVYTAVAPPITSAAALCLLIGLEAAFALELTMIASLLTPVIGPVVSKALLGEALPVDGFSLGLRVAAIIFGGGLAALALRWSLGAVRIERHAKAFDGLAAIAMWLVVVAVLDGAGARVMAEPGMALGVFALALAVNFGMQIVTAPVVARSWQALGGAAGLMWGNRTVALYLAALPFDPVFALYVAFYQVPMLFTPLIMGPLLIRNTK